MTQKLEIFPPLYKEGENLAYSFWITAYSKPQILNCRNKLNIRSLLRNF